MNFSLENHNNVDLFNIENNENRTKTDEIVIDNQKVTKYINEYWTSKQRQVSSIHEISYRACFKPQLPRFFIKLLTNVGDLIYDPFSGRGTSVIEAGLSGRNIISNDINPLSKVFIEPRFFIPTLSEIENRLNSIKIDYSSKSDIDLSMFYNTRTLSELVSFKRYFGNKQGNDEIDHIDKWIRMVATNRLTGHSSGFFSVYTLPPNQAVTQESQIKINEKRNQKPEYRDTKKLILKKSKSLLRSLTQHNIDTLRNIGKNGMFLTNDARKASKIANNSVSLTITSPPFLNIVQYSKDNWLRCWFNSIDDKAISKKITMSRTVEKWSDVMSDVFKELYRITKRYGWVAFEVGEVKNGKIKLDEYVVPIGIRVGFECQGIIINKQQFTKTSNIWGVNNNNNGTNTNRIVLFKKG